MLYYKSMSFFLKGLSIVFVLAIVGGVGGYFLLNNKNDSEVDNTSRIEEMAQITETSEAEAPSIIEVSSPDGKMSLIIEGEIENDGTIYSFFISETSNKERKLIFQKNLINSSTFEVSQNAWSPDNRYFFVKENGVGYLDYYIFRFDGEMIGSGQQYIDIGSGFNARETGFVLTDVIGWASNSLLYILTENDNGERGPTFWFEVPSSSIIRLARG